MGLFDKRRFEMNSTLKLTITIAFAATLIGLAPQMTRAQICAGSHLIYVVRDVKGATIDAANKDLKFDSNNGDSGKWAISDWEYIRNNILTPKDIAKLRGKLAVLGTEGMCIFKKPVNLQLSLKGKTMNLTFLVPRLGEHDSRDFIVDSLPFQEGSFEIELRANTDFYPAARWKKVSNKTEAVVPKSP
jgi:hypothetical protein